MGIVLTAVECCLGALWYLTKNRYAPNHCEMKSTQPVRPFILADSASSSVKRPKIAVLSALDLLSQVAYFLAIRLPRSLVESVLDSAAGLAHAGIHLSCDLLQEVIDVLPQLLPAQWVPENVHTS